MRGQVMELELEVIGALETMRFLGLDVAFRMDPIIIIIDNSLFRFFFGLRTLRPIIAFR